MSETKRPLKVFLFHAPSDKESVRDLYLRLMKEGVDAWLVKERILPSQDWKHELQQAVREADVLIVCLSEHFHQEGFRKKQVRTAFDTVIEQLREEIFLIPVRLEECDQLATLRRWQGVDLFAEAGYEMLMQALQARAETIGASIQRKEGSLPPVAASALAPEEPLPDRNSVAAMQGTHGILIEGSAVKIQASSSRRRLARAILVGLCGLIGLLLVAVLNSGSPQLDRWYKLSLMVLNETPLPTPSATALPKPKAAHANVVFLIDTTGGMRAQRISMVRSAVSDFAKRLNDNYLISVIRFDTKVELKTDLTPDRQVINDAVRAVTVDVIHNEVCLYDALYAGIQEISFAPAAEDAKNIVILLTDVSPLETTAENCSARSMEDIRRRNTRQDVSIFIVKIVDRSGFNSAEGIASDTGATFFSADTKKEIDKALLSISDKEALGLNAKPVSVPAKTTDARSETMVFVPGGEFIMGDNHNVYLDDFWIDQTEVTNAMYAKCEQAGACKAPRVSSSNLSTHYHENTPTEDYPVIFVSWLDADTYCRWAGRRLPTEAEWEKAARGTDGRPFPWGSADPAGPSGLLNYRGLDPMEVGSFPDGASPYGALDMAGNVGEWVADWFSIDYYNHLPAANPSGPDTGEYRVWRGGSWANTSLDWIQTYSRTGNLPTDSSSGLGFRCARDAGL